MLSRVADSLFWMSRYIERAENVARMLDVNIDLLLDLQALEEKEMREHWQAIILAMGDEENFAADYGEVNGPNVTDFLTVNLTNTNSIFGCIRLARENARTVREQISTEMWEQLNRLFLSVKDLDSEKIWQQGPHRFYQAIKEGAQMFHGVTDATMTHGEGWEFIRVGKFLERADKTTRHMDVRHILLHPEPEKVTHSTDAIEWMAVLKSCSALEAYRKAYSSSVEPQKIVEFLVLHDSFPRSVRFSINQVSNALRNITPVTHGQFANGAQKSAGRLRADFEFSDIGDIYEKGLHEYLDHLQDRFNQLGGEISHCYLAVPPDLVGESEMVMQQQQ